MTAPALCQLEDCIDELRTDRGVIWQTGWCSTCVKKALGWAHRAFISTTCSCSVDQSCEAYKKLLCMVVILECLDGLSVQGLFH